MKHSEVSVKYDATSSVWLEQNFLPLPLRAGFTVKKGILLYFAGHFSTQSHLSGKTPVQLLL